MPKALLEVAGEPLLVHQIQLLASYGATEVVLCVGYLGEMIEDRIGVEQNGVKIVYSYDSKNLDGTLGAIRRAQHLLGPRFLTLYGDSYLQIDYVDFYKSWENSGQLGAMAVLRNDSSAHQSNVVLREGEVVLYDKFSPTHEMHWIDYGLGALDTRALSMVGPDVTDLAYLAHEMSKQRQLFGYEATNRFYEIGTPEAWRETNEMLRTLKKGPATE
jgi:NDP-sugar pyrophosphorylase family protein